MSEFCLDPMKNFEAAHQYNIIITLESSEKKTNKKSQSLNREERVYIDQGLFCTNRIDVLQDLSVKQPKARHRTFFITNLKKKLQLFLRKLLNTGVKKTGVRPWIDTKLSPKERKLFFAQFTDAQNAEEGRKYFFQKFHKVH